MKLNAPKLGLAAAISVVGWNIVSWIISYILLSVQMRQLIGLTLNVSTLMSLFINLCVSFGYGFLLVWTAACLYNKFLEA